MMRDITLKEKSAMVNFTRPACAGLTALAGLAIILSFPAAAQTKAPTSNTGMIKSVPKKTYTRSGTMTPRAAGQTRLNINPKKMLPTGAGTRVVGPVDFHIPGGQTITPPSGNPVRIVKRTDHSYLHIYGTVHSGGMTYFAAMPIFNTISNQTRDKRPKDCKIYRSADPQFQGKNFYSFTYTFENTGSNGACWIFFTRFRTLDFTTKIVEFKEHKNDWGPDKIKPTDGENRVFTVGPVIPATQSAAK